MKSRKFLPLYSSEINGSATRGFLLARVSSGDVAASATRRFELQHNQSPRFARRRQERRKGQALLLAVLIMLLAALLSAGFLAVVSGNLNQSARIADKTRAIESSRAGIAYANAQLSGSSQGDLWRPIDVSPAPAPGTPGYDFYYSQLDKVQGWAANSAQPKRVDYADEATYQTALKNYNNVTYGKFPDPTQPSGDAPKFLVKVEEVPTISTAAGYDAKHAGEIKITSIGLSDDDPNVFHRSVAYKVGRKKSPWASALRSVSNWRFGDKDDNTGVPYGTFTRVNSTDSFYTAAPPAVFPATDVQVAVNIENAPQFSANETPFNVVIVKKAAPAAVVGAVVKEMTVSGNSATLTLAQLDKDLTPAVGESIAVQKAAAIGTGSTIDLLNTGTTTPPTIAATFPNYEQPNGILANGSLWLQNQVRLSNLSSKLTSNTTNIGTQLITSGSLAIDDSAATVSKRVLPGGDVEASPSGNQLVPSNVSYPGDNIVLTAAATSSGVKKTDIVNDGWDKIGSVKTLGLEYLPDQGRTVEPFTPAKIDSATNLARYRALTRNSAAGVYIDNRDDVEKVGTDVMTQKQLVDMFVSPTSTPALNYSRNDAALPTGSLEQRHLRGWVGPDEFLARGALVELLASTTANPGPDAPNPYVRVSLDARSDTSPNGPDANKTLRDDNGVLQVGVYSKILPWPTNGTIFAEGNLRVRGDLGTIAAPRSLTIVSLNNIYVEGSLSVDNTMNGANPSADRKKLMLLAKKNVIVNPTRAVLARTDVATIARNPTPISFGIGATLNLTVANPSAFNKGDYVTLPAQVSINDATVVQIRGLVTANPTATQINVRTSDAGYLVALSNAIVRSPLETREVGTLTSSREFFSAVKNDTAINRRLVVAFRDNTTPAYNKLNLDHVGEIKKNGTDTVGFKVTAQDFSPTVLRPTTPTFIAELTAKQPLTGGTQNLDPTKDAIATGDKILRAYNNYTPGRQDFAYPTPASTNLTQLRTDVNNNMSAQRAKTPPPGNEGFRYVSSLVDFAALDRFNPITGTFDPAKSIGNLYYFALTGVGLRYQPAATDTSLGNRRENFNAPPSPPPNPDPSLFTIPLATSVEIDLNGASSWAKVNSASTVTRYFGFAPTLAESEDIQTVDRSFYQPTDAVTKSTLDSRILDFTNPANSAGLYGSSIVLRRAAAPVVAMRPAFTLLPDYRVRSLKYEYINFTGSRIKPLAADMQINAFVYAQEGSWLVIPGDYFRSNPQVRGEIDPTTKALIGSYIDYGNTIPGVVQADIGEYILDTSVTPNVKVADLNRNSVVDPGEREAALRYVRSNTVPIKFLGAIVENQTAVVADVKNGATILAKGAVQDWMDKWATYDNTIGLPPRADYGKPAQFSFISYAYDPTLANGAPGANQLRVPVTDDLLYEQ